MKRLLDHAETDEVLIHVHVAAINPFRSGDPQGLM